MPKDDIDQAHAIIVDLLRELDLENPTERLVFEECLATAHMLGRVADYLAEEERVTVRPAPIRLLQVA